MNLAQARRIANELVENVRPYCVRAEIAGSIRRGKPEVKDIELVVIPKWENHTNALLLFAQPEPINLLHEWAISTGVVRWIKPGTPDIVTWSVKPDGKYWRGLLPQEIKLDLFLTTPESWGIIFLIRTGSAEFSEAVVTHAKRIGKRCLGGYLQTAEGDVIETPEEESVFKALGLEYVSPDERVSSANLRARRDTK